MASVSTLDGLIYGYRLVSSVGVEQVSRIRINFGAGFVVSDNPSTETTDVSALSTVITSGDVDVVDGVATVVALQSRAVVVTAPTDGQALVWNDGASQWEPGTPGVASSLGGDVTGDLDDNTVVKLQNRTLINTAPSSGQAIVWNSGSSRWEPGTPALTLVGDVTGSYGATTVGKLQNRTLVSTAPSSGQAVVWNSGSSQWEPGAPALTLAGDVTGGYGANTVSKLQNRTLVSTAPTNGQAVVWNNGSSQWEPGAPALTLAGDVTGGYGANTVSKLQNRTLVSTAPSNGQAVVWNNGSSQWEPGTPALTLAGDVTGGYGANTVGKLQNRTLVSTAPTNGQAIVWNNGASQWEPGTASSAPSGSAGGSLGSTYPNPTVVQIDGASGNCPIACAKTTWAVASGCNVVSQGDAGQTTNATATTLATYALGDNRVADFSAVIVGRRSSNGDSFRIAVEATYKRTSGGNCVLIGSVTPSGQRADSGASAWVGTITFSTTNVLIQVTGQASVTIDWVSVLTVQERA